MTKAVNNCVLNLNLNQASSVGWLVLFRGEDDVLLRHRLNLLGCCTQVFLDHARVDVLQPPAPQSRRPAKCPINALWGADKSGLALFANGGLLDSSCNSSPTFSAPDCF